MEPIDYRRAIVRRLPLILALMLIGGAVGSLVSVHEPKQVRLWQATSTVSVPPPGTNLSTISVQEVAYFAEQTPVFDATAKALGSKKRGLTYHQFITVTIPKGKKSKAPGPSTVQITAAQATPPGAVRLANQFVHQLQIYVTQQLVNIRKQDIAQTTAAINKISLQLEQVSEQIADLEKHPAKKPPAKTPPTTTTTKPKSSPPTTTTTVSTSSTTSTTSGTTDHSRLVPSVTNYKVTGACDAIEAQGLSCAPSSEYLYQPSSVPAAFVIGTRPPAGTALNPGSVVNLVISEGEVTTTTQPSNPTTTTTTTTPTTVPTTVPQTTWFGPSGAFTMGFVQAATSSSSTTTSTTAPNAKGRLGLLEAEQKSLTAEYQQYVGRLQTLQTAASPRSGISVVSQAQAKFAKLEKLPSVNPFAHLSVRVGTGVAGGLILGALIALLLDALDKRLRRSQRASEVFGLPVIAEIPRTKQRQGDPTAPSPRQPQGPKVEECRTHVRPGGRQPVCGAGGRAGVANGRGLPQAPHRSDVHGEHADPAQPSVGGPGLVHGQW